MAPQDIPAAVAVTGLVVMVIVLVAVVTVLVVSFATHEADEVRAHRDELEQRAAERSATRSWGSWLPKSGAGALSENERWAREKLLAAQSRRDVEAS